MNIRPSRDTIIKKTDGGIRMVNAPNKNEKYFGALIDWSRLDTLFICIPIKGKNSIPVFRFIRQNLMDQPNLITDRHLLIHTIFSHQYGCKLFVKFIF